MNKFQIKNQKDFEDCLMWVSDLYKDVYGIRPRGYDFHKYTFKKLETYVNELLYISQEQEHYQNSMEAKAIKDVMALGCDKETALRWLDDADAHYDWNDDEWAVEDMKKYGWEAKHSKDYRGAIDLW